MNIEDKTIWQQAAGDTNRRYIGLCFDKGVILNGPADGGPWDSWEEFRKEYHWLGRKATDVWRFWEEMKDGDLVVLRFGTNAVYGVGEIVGGYEWCEEFNDVDGWNIGHVRRVRWLWDYRKDNEEEPKRFPTYTLKQGDTTQRLTSVEVKSWLETLDVPDALNGREIKSLVDMGSSRTIDVDDIRRDLLDNSLSPPSVDHLINLMRELQRIAEWYVRHEEGVSEYETISYFVAPLLQALGWPPQRMAIEWNKIDIALFSRRPREALPSSPREAQSLSVAVEAKKLRSSSLSALHQAQQYAKSGAYPHCNRVVLTDGLRYGVFYKRESGEFRPYPDAYLNLTRLRDRYPIYDDDRGNCKGAAEALFIMSPEWR